MWQNPPKCGNLTHHKRTAFLFKVEVLAFGTATMHTALALPPNGNVSVEVQQCGYIGCWQDNNVKSTSQVPLPQKPDLPQYLGYAWIGKSNQIYTTKSYFYDSRQAEELSRLYIADTALSECIAKHGACDKGGMVA